MIYIRKAWLVIGAEKALYDNLLNSPNIITIALVKLNI